MLCYLSVVERFKHMEEEEWKWWQLHRLHIRWAIQTQNFIVITVWVEVAKHAIISAVEHKIPCDRRMDGQTEHPTLRWRVQCNMFQAHEN